MHATGFRIHAALRSGSDAEQGIPLSCTHPGGGGHGAPSGVTQEIGSAAAGTAEANARAMEAANRVARTRIVSRVLRAVGGDRRVDDGVGLPRRKCRIVLQHGGIGVCAAVPGLKVCADLAATGLRDRGVGDCHPGNLRSHPDKGLVRVNAPRFLPRSSVPVPCDASLWRTHTPGPPAAPARPRAGAPRFAARSADLPRSTRRARSAPAAGSG